MPHRLFSFLLPLLAAAFLSVQLAQHCAAQQTIVKVKPKTTTTTKKKTTTTTKKKTTNRTASLVMTSSRAIDLGLSVKWAEWNVGASSPEQAGGYYAWGELSPKSIYTESTYKYHNGNDYTSIGSSISGNASYDVARAQWGYPWRMPTNAEIEELINRCKWTWTTYRGMNGYEVTGPNGNAIFLPASGNRYNSSLCCYGKDGNYWSGTLVSGAYNVQFLDFGSSIHGMGWSNRVYGMSVRPVSD